MTVQVMPATGYGFIMGRTHYGDKKPVCWIGNAQDTLPTTYVKELVVFC
jgi:hypothetical protein